ncbi:hypothetical protein D0C36_23865 [Mucilaginibacter conchicola]|uniref:Uncharacterized protein n=1 Tax=Mucilaginibacter conchicola TaxID=2303333 RepID=A0A372NN23_9SPHI|nr:hypothetical protein [Mucilaginibacter conchicola]RFZ89997.1 hypothetical protein D0C36_23865 [Mucilaginibacter conchicola]
MTTTLAYKISRDLSNLSCQLHHLSLSTKTSKESTIVKVCCSYFKDDVLTELNKRYGAAFVEEQIRFTTPANDSGIVTASNSFDE